MSDKQIRLTQYAVAAVVIVIALALILLQLSHKGPYLVGTNHVPPLAFTVKLDKGQEVCQPQQVIPKHTAGLVVRTDRQDRPDNKLRLTVNGGLATYRSKLPAGFGQGDIRFILPPSLEETAATVCIKNYGRRKIALAGVGEFYPNLPVIKRKNVEIDGRLKEAQISITFRGRGEKRTLDLMTTIAARAALFRPEIFSKWFYLALPLLLLLIYLLAIRALVRSDNDG